MGVPQQQAATQSKSALPSEAADAFPRQATAPQELLQQTAIRPTFQPSSPETSPLQNAPATVRLPPAPTPLPPTPRVGLTFAPPEGGGPCGRDRATGLYRPGDGIIRLAQSAERTHDLRAFALPEMESLAKATHETVSLEVFDGVAASVAICQIDGPNLTPMPDITGRPIAMHAIASGKVLLASLPERTVLSTARRGLVRHTPRTIIHPTAPPEEPPPIPRPGHRSFNTPEAAP